MDKPRYRVLALDLDGTLTNSEKIVTDVTREALQKIARAGVKIVLASGRPAIGMQQLADSLNLKELDGYILAFNGAQVVSCRTGETLYTSAIPHECIAQSEEIARKFDVAVVAYDDKGILSTRPEDPFVNQEVINTGLPIELVSDIAARVTWPTPKVMLVGDPEKLAPCLDYTQKYFEGVLSVFFSARYFLECTSPGVSKSDGLEKLLNLLGETRDALMACGDGLNDLSMIEYAGLGVAMANSDPEVIEAADVVTASNDENGVAKAIYKYILEEEMPG